MMQHAADRIRSNDALREGISGALAGAGTKCLLAPLDRIKLMIQLQGSMTEKQKKDMIQERRLGTTFQVARNIYQKEGLWAFWRGNTPTIIIQGATAAFNFMFMDFYKKTSKRMVLQTYGESVREERQIKVLISFLSGGLAGGTCLTLMYPLGLLRTQLALDVGVGVKDRKYPRGMRDVVRLTLANNGLRGLFAGYGVALFSVTLYRTIYLGGYDAVKGLIEESKERPTTLAERSMAAQSVSVLASIAHYPLDSVRRRMMMQSNLAERRYHNAWHCFRQIYVKEGLTGFYLGIGTNLIRSFGAALLLVSYDFFKTQLSRV